MYDWFNSCLSERHIIIRVGNSYDNPIILRRGVPHGSGLGPILWLI